jgi:hypothetical protein
MNDWHTCPAAATSARPIRARNTCSSTTRCNLASANLLTFYDADQGFDVEAYEHLCRLWTVVLEISVMMAQFPSRDRRTLLRIPHARPRLRQYRRPADDHGHSYDSKAARSAAR